MIGASIALVTTPDGMTWLLSCAIKAALLLAAAWLGATLWRRGSAAARHQIWALGMIGALVLPVLCAGLPSLPRSLAVAPTLPQDLGTPALAAPALIVGAGPVTDGVPTWPTWLAIGWALGTLVVVLRLVRGQRAARRLVRAAEPRIADAWTAALRAAAGSLALAHRVHVLRSTAIHSPMTIGVVRPRVLLPAAADGWSPARLRAVLVHELGHVRRRDTVVQLAAQLGCALYWWNPLAWLAAARLRLEREHACDDLVLGTGILPSSYAADLLEVARAIARATHAPAGAIGIVDRSSTEVRLRRILDAATARQPPRAGFRRATRGLALACVVTIACTSTPMVQPAPTPSARAPAPAPLGTLSIGLPFIRTAGHDALDLSAVTTEVRRRLGDLEQCYAGRLATEPALSGTVVLHWTIAASGEVADTCVTQDTVGDDMIATCVNALVRQAPFPAPRGGAVDVSFPFVFTAQPAGFTLRAPPT